MQLLAPILGSLQEHVSDISMHSATCKKATELTTTGVSPVELSSEIDTYGLASILSARCKGCHREILLNASPKLNIDNSQDILILIYEQYGVH